MKNEYTNEDGVRVTDRRDDSYLEYLKSKIITTDLLDEIADKIADKIIDKVEEDMTNKVAANLKTMAYAAVGKTVIEKIFYAIGLITMTVLTFMKYRGLI
jgi:S-adenosylmethionine synthetase